MSYNAPDRNSPYYYGTDGTYIPKSKPTPNTRPQYELDFYGVPQRGGVSSSGIPLKDSEYYYGTDNLTYTPRKQAPPKARPNIELDFYGVPKIVEKTTTTTTKSKGPKVLPSRSVEELRAEQDEYRKTKYGAIDPSEPAPKPTLDRGDELSREIDQSALNEMATRLAGEGIQFRHGFNSNTLPGYTIGTAAGMDGNLVEDSQGGISSKGLEVLINANNVSNPQTGVSSIPDEVDSARAVPIPHPRSRNNRDGLGVDERFAEGADYGNPPKSAISDRSRAILDYEGGMMGALKAGEASQGYMRHGGRNYAITGQDEQGKYTFTEFNDEGLKQLKNDRNSTINHEFMDTYAMGDRPTPDQAQSPEIGFTTKADLETMNYLREAPVTFGVGDGSAEQLIDFSNNFEKMVLDPADWMSRYREGLR